VYIVATAVVLTRLRPAYIAVAGLIIVVGLPSTPLKRSRLCAQYSRSFLDGYRARQTMQR